MISATAVEKPSVAWPAAKVEIWPIERLAANPRNARIHGLEQIEQIAGHGRLEAAKLEGISEVPTIVARGWTEAQCQAYAIADNKLTEAGEWSEELLRLELGDLKAEAGYEGFWLYRRLASITARSQPVRRAGCGARGRPDAGYLLASGKTEPAL